MRDAAGYGIIGTVSGAAQRPDYPHHSCTEGGLCPMDTISWIITCLAVLVIVVLLVIAMRTNRKTRDAEDEETFQRMRKEWANALAVAQESVIHDLETEDVPEAKDPAEPARLTDGTDGKTADEEEEEEEDTWDDDEEPDDDAEFWDDESEDGGTKAGGTDEAVRGRSDRFDDNDNGEPDDFIDDENEEDDEDEDDEEDDDADGEETGAETAGALPDMIDGLWLLRTFENVQAVSDNQDGIPVGTMVSVLPIGKNVFIRQGKKIVGRIKKKSVSQEITAWCREERPVCAMVTDLDEDEELVTLSVGLYDNLHEAAMREKIPPVKLGGSKRADIQEALNDTPVGTVCSLALEMRQDKHPRWLVISHAGVIGTLELGDATEDQRAVLMAVEPRKKGDGNKGLVALL